MILEEQNNNKTKNIDWYLISILLIAFFLRFFMLDLRPPHHDEGVNGWFANQVWANGYYHYDPTNYHGPLNIYTLFAFQALLGQNLYVLRLPTVLISLLSIYWITLFSSFIGRRTALIAALAMALSPANVFFGRYINIDTSLTFCAILITWGIIGLYQEGKSKYLWATGMGITGMILIKETYIINIIVFIVAWGVLSFWERFFPSQQIQRSKQLWLAKDLKQVIFTGIGLIIFFYSGTFLDLPGVNGLFQTFQTWLKTGQSSGHSKPFLYWTTCFFQYEQIAMIGLFLAVRCLFIPSNKWIRYVSIYGLGMFLVYSIIPYKTPWCIVNLLWPFYFVFGELVANFLKTKWRNEITITLVALFLFSSFLTIRLNFFHYDDNKEPYVYVHTSRDINKFVTPLLKIAKDDNANYNLVGHIIREGEWPLPWILGDFTMVGYYSKDLKPLSYDADFLLVESKKIIGVESNLKNKYFTENLTMRDSQDPSKAYFNYEKFKYLFPGRNPEFAPVPLLPGQGLLAEYFTNKNWNGEPVSLKQVDKIDFYWEGENKILPAPFSATYSGDIYFSQTPREIIFASDDGGFVEIDGQRVINDPGPHAVMESKTVINGKPGWRKIRLGFYDEGGGAIVKLMWIDDKGNKVIVPKESLRFDERLFK